MGSPPTETVLVSESLPAVPQRIYGAWLDPREHAAFTGSPATVEAQVGGRYTAWDGYIEGVTLELEPGRRIVQSWRTSEFPVGHPDSRVEITLEPTMGGTLLTLLHTGIPSGQSDRYKEGWVEFYFAPMKRHFVSLVTRDLARAAASREAAGPASGTGAASASGGGAARGPTRRTTQVLSPSSSAATGARTAVSGNGAAKARMSGEGQATKARASGGAKPAKVRLSGRAKAAKASVSGKAKPAKARAKARVTKPSRARATSARRSAKHGVRKGVQRGGRRRASR